MTESDTSPTARPALTLTLSHRERGYRRRAFKLLLFLLAGAIINVAVAWGFAAARESMTIERNQQGYFAIWNRPWLVVQQQRFGMIDVWWGESDDDNPKSIPAEPYVKERIEAWEKMRLTDPRMRSGRPRELLTHVPRWGTFGGEPLPLHIADGGDIAFGFPSACLWMQTTCDIINLTTVNDQLHGGWLMRGTLYAHGNEFIALPTRVIWPNFAINTMFYGGILWFCCAAPSVLRRKRRLRRGQCAACGYSLRESASDKCPECGCSSPSPSGRGPG